MMNLPHLIGDMSEGIREDGSVIGPNSIFIFTQKILMATAQSINLEIRFIIVRHTKIGQFACESGLTTTIVKSSLSVGLVPVIALIGNLFGIMVMIKAFIMTSPLKAVVLEAESGSD
jgi:hypothetical protein